MKKKHVLICLGILFIIYISILFTISFKAKDSLKTIFLTNRNYTKEISYIVDKDVFSVLNPDCVYTKIVKRPFKINVSIKPSWSLFYIKGGYVWVKYDCTLKDKDGKSIAQIKNGKLKLIVQLVNGKWKIVGYSGNDPWL